MYKYQLAVDAGLTNTVLSDRILDLTRNRNRTQQFKLIVVNIDTGLARLYNMANKSSFSFRVNSRIHFTSSYIEDYPEQVSKELRTQLTNSKLHA